MNVRGHRRGRFRRVQPEPGREPLAPIVAQPSQGVSCPYRAGFRLARVCGFIRSGANTSIRAMPRCLAHFMMTIKS